MKTGDSDRRPVQVFLETKKFIAGEPPRTFALGHKDFFDGDERGFSHHKQEVRTRLRSISGAMREQRLPAGFLKVQVRDDALAKSHRPLGALFTEAHGFAFVAAGRIGEMLVQATPASLDKLDALIEEHAETHRKMVLNKKTNELEHRPSGYRSEVGAIAAMALYDEIDRVPFSAEEATDWMAQPGTLGGYVVELFEPNTKLAPQAVATLVSALEGALLSLPVGVRVRPIDRRSDGGRQLGDAPPTVSIRLIADPRVKDVELPFPRSAGSQATPKAEVSPQLTDLRVESHQALLRSLASQALVRSVELPPVIEAAPAARPSGRGDADIAPPSEAAVYPIVGIIDGGVADLPCLNGWRAGGAEFVPSGDRDSTHGTFIAGLVAGGATLNPNIAASLEAPCKFYDLDIFPRKELRQTYFDSVEYFIDVLEEKIKAAKAACPVRIFNLSFGLRTPIARFGYSPLADRLDRIARTNDIVLVVSAGNLPPGSMRPCWPTDPVGALSMLAASAASGQGIVAPAEHLLGLTVGAINPPDIPGHEWGMPTTYTRRGPGVGGARKPDLAHYGGVDGSGAAVGACGLTSIAPAGTLIENCGTSFATPIVAATIATLDHRLSQAQPREVLLALPAHRASRQVSLEAKLVRHLSREFVGFGRPPTADELLSDDPHSITLLFSETLLAKQKLEFPFVWPSHLVDFGGVCRGRVRLTLAYTPPIDGAHREEAQRVMLEAHLHQQGIDPETGEIVWTSQLRQDGSDGRKGMGKTERDLLALGVKWSPIKRYEANMPKGRGASSNWRLSLDSLLRIGASFPAHGVPFAVVLTISDPARMHPIYDTVRNALVTQGLSIADITVAHRVRPRSR